MNRFLKELLTLINLSRQFTKKYTLVLCHKILILIDIYLLMQIMNSYLKKQQKKLIGFYTLHKVTWINYFHFI